LEFCREVVFAQGFHAVLGGIEKGGYKEAALGAESIARELDFDDANGEGLGNVGELVLADALGGLDGLGPSLKAVAGSEFFAFGYVGFAGLVESDDAVDAAIFQVGKGVVGAKSSVGEMALIVSA
jgi:hypothetical protein